MENSFKNDTADLDENRLDSIDNELKRIYGIKLDQESGVDILEINYNPIPEMAKRTPAPIGSFGPFPLRTHTDKIMYGCGCSYFFGLTVGGLYGAGLSMKYFPNNSLKVWHAMFLNHTTRYGPKFGNALGVLSLGWTMLDSLMGLVRGKSDYFNHLSSAFITGSIYKCSAGLRPSLFAGTLFTSVIGGYKLYEDLTRDKIPIPMLLSRDGKVRGTQVVHSGSN